LIKQAFTKLTRSRLKLTEHFTLRGWETTVVHKNRKL